ncbi:sugar-binding domain-containing protein [Rhodoferax sp. GW822-FHT02A01]|uniref:sugar-binding transcriptional regulator n=1 Tax=Rhodoferax sp. GW822-FHT02A01 TaxID=3141537 RepID=UPI00315CF6B6
MGQAQIAEQLGLSQAKVSRLLKQSEQLGIVKITVHVPPGVHAEVESRVESLFGIDECLVVEVPDAQLDVDDAISQALASSVASYLELMVPTMESIAVSSWSSTLLAAVNVMRPTASGVTRHVVQAFGGVGQPSVQRFATQLTERLAHLSHAEPTFMMAPGIAASPEAKRAIEADAACTHVLTMFDNLSGILMGIGSTAPSRMLRDSGNIFSDRDIEELKAAGAVGDVCLRFFDANGKLVRTGLNDRIIGIEADQVLKARRRIGVAGGPRKFEAIRGSLRGKWISTLITDLDTAKRLIESP